MQLTGKVIEILPQTQYGKEGKLKGGLVLEYTAGNKTKNIALTAFGQTMERTASLKKGSTVSVEFDVESREYQGKWYTDCTCWKIEAQGGTAATPSPQAKVDAGNQTKDDLPF